MKQNRSKHTHWIQFRSTIILLILLFSSSAMGATSSYDVNIPPQTYFPCAWHFTASTVGTAFPNPTDGERIYLWNAGSQQFTTILADEGWTSPNAALNPGDGFFYYNNRENEWVTITVGGTNNTASLTNSLLANNWYLLCSAYPQSTTNANFLECIFDSNSSPVHTDDSFQWPFSNGDIVQMWDESLRQLIGGQRKGPSDGLCNAGANHLYWWKDQAGGCFWFNGTSNAPQMRLGRAIWFMPSSNRTLVRTTSAPTTCF
jgi:hypothetical protein